MCAHVKSCPHACISRRSRPVVAPTHQRIKTTELVFVAFPGASEETTLPGMLYEFIGGVVWGGILSILLVASSRGISGYQVVYRGMY